MHSSHIFNSLLLFWLADCTGNREIFKRTKLYRVSRRDILKAFVAAKNLIYNTDTHDSEDDAIFFVFKKKRCDENRTPFHSVCRILQTYSRIFCRVFSASFFSKNKVDGQILYAFTSFSFDFSLSRAHKETLIIAWRKSARIMTNKHRGKCHFLLWLRAYRDDCFVMLSRPDRSQFNVRVSTRLFFTEETKLAEAPKFASSDVATCAIANHHCAICTKER